jgi:hypothetical protein
MTATTADTAGLSESWSVAARAVQQAAVKYAQHGWPVLPGSAWNGRRFVVPGTLKITDGVRPSVARNLATTDVTVVARWWNADTRMEPSVLVRSGQAFNLVSVAFDLAQRVMSLMEAAGQTAPVLYQPDLGRACFFVRCEPLLTGAFGRPGQVVAVAPGDWVGVPPTRTGNSAHIRWWSTPELAAWSPIDVPALSDTLKAA